MINGIIAEIHIFLNDNLNSQSPYSLGNSPSILRPILKETT